VKTLLLIIAAISLSLSANAETRQTKSILFVGDTKDERGQAYVKFLKEHFTNVSSVDHKETAPDVTGIDVVVLDWPQGKYPTNHPSPLGQRENWHTPTVLVGSAGLQVAERWQLLGGWG
jgi:hypothetical protein